MPLKGFVCPSTAPTAGNRNELQHCLGKCPHPCVSPPLLNAIYQADRGNHHKGSYISASMLSGSSCPRQTVYERNSDFYEHAVRRFWAFRGTHAHSIIEGGASTMVEYGYLQEMRMAVPIEYPEEPAPIFDDEGNFTGKYDHNKPLIITLGGTTDCYNPVHPPYPLHDYKSMADLKAEMFIKGSKPGTFSPNLDDKWVWQLNIYRWLVANTPIAPDVRERFNLQGTYYPAPEELTIQAISMMTIPRSGAPYSFKHKEYQIDPVPVFPLDEIEQFIRVEALKWHKWLVIGEPAPVVPEDMAWLCKVCPFNGEVVPEGPCFPSKERDVVEVE